MYLLCTAFLSKYVAAGERIFCWLFEKAQRDTLCISEHFENSPAENYPFAAHILIEMLCQKIKKLPCYRYSTAAKISGYAFPTPALSGSGSGSRRRPSGTAKGSTRARIVSADSVISTPLKFYFYSIQYNYAFCNIFIKKRERERQLPFSLELQQIRKAQHKDYAEDGEHGANAGPDNILTRQLIVAAHSVISTPSNFLHAQYTI